MKKIIGYVMMMVMLSVAGILATPETRELLNIAYKTAIFMALIPAMVIGVKRGVERAWFFFIKYSSGRTCSSTRRDTNIINPSDRGIYFLQ